jgi:hypothetical protein
VLPDVVRHLTYRRDQRPVHAIRASSRSVRSAWR